MSVESEDKAKRFNIGRMGLAYVVVIGTMALAAVLLFSVADKDIDPAVVWVSVSGIHWGGSRVLLRIPDHQR